MRLFLTSSSNIEPLPDLEHNCSEVFRTHGVREGTPFILGSDGYFDLNLNRFLRALPLLGLSSIRSWHEYASDILVWCRWLDEVLDKQLWSANFEDVQAFYSARRDGVGSTPITAATWNRNVAALNKLYTWAEIEGLVDRNPFVSSGSKAVFNARSKRPHSSPKPVIERLPRRRLKYLTLGEFDQFCKVGFMGRDSRGQVIAGDKTLQGNRNATFASVCVSTGFRLEEANSILCVEVPKFSRAGSAPGLVDT